ncbi:hypothetical protein V1514DRAFT_323223 [Lipomyces japonicus]|uniref:uncharacterized protein n=1 Tax=Lipomyces japonicus TaxID=56871 RepID=UPI0034CFFD4D
MAPKADINKSSWEDTDVPAVCDNCLGPNPYVRMTRERHGEECKLCTRPFTVFRWLPEKSSSAGGRYKKTAVCQTCARQKNCCQSCMMDLSFGLPVAIRDAALKMVGAAGAGSSTALTTVEPQNVISKQFVAQNIEERLRLDGNGDVELYDVQSHAEDAGKALLRKLAQSEAYHKPSNVAQFAGGTTFGSRGGNSRTSHSFASRHGGVTKPNEKINSKITELSKPLTTPNDKSISSLFISGVTDDLAEYVIRNFFTNLAPLKSVVCSHRSKCAMINFASRDGAEVAARATGTAIVLDGHPLRVTWARPRPIGDFAHNEQNLKQARADRRRMVQEARDALRRETKVQGVSAPDGTAQQLDEFMPKLPPGQVSVTYASQRPDYDG